MSTPVHPQKLQYFLGYTCWKELGNLYMLTIVYQSFDIWKKDIKHLEKRMPELFAGLFSRKNEIKRIDITF